MDPYTETNRHLWNGWTTLHLASALYDLDGFRAGQSSLQDFEREELGDVAGKSLLHLQCHFGQDTLSLARLGAQVTGVDLSDRAIAEARKLSEELQLPATFIQSDVYALPDVLDETFDIVFTSYGVLSWLPDLDRWAQIIARYLRPGGIFYIVEFHPILGMFDDTGTCCVYPYFPQEEPLRFEARGSYADTTAAFTHDAYEWPHSLGEIVTALLTAGLQLEYLHEFPYSPYNCFPFLEERAPGRYVLRGHLHPVPHVFSIRARRMRNAEWEMRNEG